MANENLSEQVRQVFLDNSKPVYVYFLASKSKGANFDPERQAGFDVQLQNPIVVQAIIRDIQPEKLSLKEMGLTESGAKELLIKDKDFQAIKLAYKIIIDGDEYYKYLDAVGKKFLIWKRPFGYFRIWLFRKEK